MCELAPEDKRELAKRVGEDLLAHYVKKPYYSVDEVKAANRRKDVSIDIGCWAHSLFNDRASFDAHHRAIGQTCDYDAMHADMMSAISTDATAGADGDSLFDFSWIELPDIDLSGLFDGFDLF